MDKITRYLFILICLIAFLVLAPLIIFYVSGTSVDDDGEYRQTGIFTVDTDPDNAKVHVDDRPAENSPATIRFLPEGEYSITITKDGYFEWSKRLLIEPGKVSYGHEGVDKLNLIKLPDPKIMISGGVTSFTMVDNTVWFGGLGKIGYAPLDNPEAAKFISVPITVRSITTLRDNNYLLLQNELGRKVVVSRSTATAWPLPELFNTATDLYTTNNGMLLARVDNVIRLYDFATKTETGLFTAIVGFTFIDSTAYIANQASGETFLETAEWNGITLTNNQPILDTVLPSVENIQLLITQQKELFAKIGQTLYRINAQPEIISSNVVSANLDYNTNELTFRTPSELWFYNFLGSAPQLLTRNTSTIHDYQVRSRLGYGFISSPAGLEMLEIDSRNRQNHYVLLQGKPVWAVSITDNLKTVVALQGDQLLLVPIR